jgi:hypothetical protein
LTHDERNTLLAAATAEYPGSSTLDYMDVISPFRRQQVLNRGRDHD